MGSVYAGLPQLTEIRFKAELPRADLKNGNTPEIRTASHTKLLGELAT